MVGAILFSVSIVALGQFGLYYWRATIADTAGQSVSDRVRLAAGIQTISARARDFRAILSVYDMTPDLRGDAAPYRRIRTYYTLVQTIGNLIPPVAKWAESELDMCSRYVAVLVDQHLNRNRECAARVRSI